MKNIIKQFSLIIAFVFTATVMNAQGDFISPKDFSKAIKDKNTVVISAQKESNYKKSHIKGSVYVNHKDLYKAGKPEGIIKSNAELAKIFGAKGISNKNMIILYDDGKNKYSARIYWILKYLGATNVKLLAKDMGEWRKARVPITKAKSKRAATTFTAKTNKSIIADYNYVKSSIGKSSVLLLDVRHLTEFNGTSKKPISKGHLPGAKNIEWNKLEKANGTLLSSGELAKLFNGIGATKDKTIVIYCATSVRSGIVFVALKSLGYTKVKVYDGAYNEWVAKGEKLEK